MEMVTGIIPLQREMEQWLAGKEAQIKVWLRKNYLEAEIVDAFANMVQGISHEVEEMTKDIDSSQLEADVGPVIARKIRKLPAQKAEKAVAIVSDIKRMKEEEEGEADTAQEVFARMVELAQLFGASDND